MTTVFPFSSNEPYSRRLGSTISLSLRGYRCATAASKSTASRPVRPNMEEAGVGSEVVQEDFFERSGAQSSGSDGSFSPSPDTSDQFAVRSPSEKEMSAMLRVPSENVRNGFPGSIERVKGILLS